MTTGDPADTSEMLAMLRELASRSLDEDGFECGSCAWCGHAVDAEAHFPDCRLAALLAKADSAPVVRQVGVLHSRDEVTRLQDENDILRGIVASIDHPCIYCGLTDKSRCERGFPGCAWADDLLAGERAANVRLAALEAIITRIDVPPAAG